MKNISTELLRTYVAVVELGGFTQAGELLGRTQPAISLQIKRLEELLGCTLLLRSGQHVELNPAGSTLFDYAKQILQLNDEALSLFKTTSVSGKIHFGIPSEFASTLLPKIVGRFTQAYPNVTLEVTSALSKDLLANKKQQAFDLILALHNKPQISHKTHIKEEELVWVGSKHHDAPSDATLPLIAAPEGCLYRRRAIEQLRANKIRWRMVYSNPDLNGIQAAIEEGLGITVLARSTVPSNLKVLKSPHYPSLHSIGVNLIKQKSTDAIEALYGFVKSSLK